MKFELVRKVSREGIDVVTSCRTLGVSSGGYYGWRKRPMSQRDKDNERLIKKISNIHLASRQTYGVPRITKRLKRDGEACGKNRIARLMRQKGLCGVAQRRYKVKTTDSRHDYPIVGRLFQTEVLKTHPTRPNEVWASDITYIPTDDGWLFLAIFLDLFTRKIVGYSMADHMRTELVLQALDMAILNQRPDGKNLVAHSDRGSQYAADDMRKRLDLLKITASMSRKGNCYDNAYAESFFHTLKVELIHRRKFKTRKEAMVAIFEYIEGWYNKHRLHSSLGYQTPIEYEQLHLAA